MTHRLFPSYYTQLTIRRIVVPVRVWRHEDEASSVDFTPTKSKEFTLNSVNILSI